MAMGIAERLPLAEVKNRLAEVVEQVETQHARVTITKHGKPAAVVISAEDLDSSEEALRVLSDPEAPCRSTRITRRGAATSEADQGRGCPATGSARRGAALHVDALACVRNDHCDVELLANAIRQGLRRLGLAVIDEHDLGALLG